MDTMDSKDEAVAVVVTEAVGSGADGGGGGGGDCDQKNIPGKISEEGEMCGKCSLAVEKRCLDIDKRFLAMEKRFVEIEKLAMMTEMRSAQMPVMVKGQEEISRRLFYIAMDVEKLRVAVLGLGGDVQPLFTQTLGQEHLAQSQKQAISSGSKKRSGPEKSKHEGQGGKDKAARTAENPKDKAAKTVENPKDKDASRHREGEKKIAGPKSKTHKKCHHKSKSEAKKARHHEVNTNDAIATTAAVKTDSKEQAQKVQHEKIPILKIKHQINSTSEEKKKRKNSSPKKHSLKIVKQEPIWNCKISDFEFEPMEQQVLSSTVPGSSKNTDPGQGNQSAKLAVAKPVVPTSVNENDKEGQLQTEIANQKPEVKSKEEELQLELSKKRQEVITQWKINAIKSPQEVVFETERLDQQHPLDFSMSRHDASYDHDLDSAEMSSDPQGKCAQDIGQSRVEVELSSFEIPFRQELQNKLQKSKEILANDLNRQAHCIKHKSNIKTGRPKLDDPRERRYACNFCGNKYLSKSGLFDHFKRSHQIAGSLHHSIFSGTLKEGVGAIIKPHPCNNCGEKFIGSQALALHKMHRRCHSKAYHSAYTRPSIVRRLPLPKTAGPSANCMVPNFSSDLKRVFPLFPRI